MDLGPSSHADVPVVQQSNSNTRGTVAAASQATAGVLRSHETTGLTILTKRPASPCGAVLETQQSKKTKKSTRAGAPNYNNDDINALLEIVESVEPLGANHWAAVGARYGEWATNNARPVRDHDSLKNKFDKLSNMKKKTGDPSYPEPVRRVKHIARAIHNKCAAMTLGDSSEGEEASVVAVDGSEGGNHAVATPSDSDTVGSRKNKRKTGATGTPTKKAEVILLEHIGTMSQHVGEISQAIKESTVPPITKSDVISIVREEVRQSMKPTSDLLLKMNTMLENLTSKGQA